MKQIFKIFAFLLLAVTISTPLTSCSDEHKGGSILSGTKWQYVERESEGSTLYVLTETFSFDTNTAILEFKYEITEGNNTTYDVTKIHYTYTYNDGLVVFTPQEEGKAYLEGRIYNNVKMVVTNTSTDKVIGTYYKL